MRRLMHKIQTKRCTWEISIYRDGLSFYIVRDQSHYEPVAHNAVPKTVWRRAKPFLIQPTRFGVVKYL